MHIRNLKFVLLVLCFFGFDLILIAENSAGGHDPNWKVPASAAAKRNPLAKDPAAAKAGKLAFDRTCSACHGAKGDAGLAGASNLRSPAVQAQSDGALEWKITNGNFNKGMPSFNSIPEHQRWEIVRYIRTLKDSK
ncbi:MAG TPA: c-type cytochrome [Terriglobales bacterium]|nr:c-type cytochrome [Terriglobales bacterium]